MKDRIIPFIDKLLLWHYLALALITPIIFTTQTTELYEVPKMFFVYAVSLILLFLTVTKFIISRKILIPKNPVTFAFAVFVAIQTLSTFFSIDKYTSIFGFPTRLNGGLLSQFAYLVIFATALINLSKDRAKKILLTTVATAIFVSLWGIPSHFGRDPSCLILTGQLTSGCWQADFNPQLRIFSTLGQPNWLASYLVLTIPLSLAMSLFFKSTKGKILFASFAIIQFMALVLTASRAGLAGILASLLLFFILTGVKNISKNWKLITFALVTFLVIFTVFGTNLTSRSLEPVSQIQETKTNTTTASQNQETSLPTESVKIRLIVWQGAFDIFKKWPALGSGPETFVSSYFMLRPQVHNKTSEWAFYYNKAHNEFLNYLATGGALGFLSYLALIFAIAYSLYKTFRDSSRPALPAGRSDFVNIASIGALAAFAGYLVTIFFGFSVVATQTTLFLILASTIAGAQTLKFYQLNLPQKKYQFPILIVTIVVCAFMLSHILRAFASDILNKRAQNRQSVDAEKALYTYRNSLTASPFKNPYLIADAANTQATYLNNFEVSGNQQLIDNTDKLAQSAYDLSENNYLIVQKVAKTYLLIANYSEDYQDKAETLGNRLTLLAPTYPDAWLTLAKIQIVLEKNDEAANSLDKALSLKPDYIEAQELLEQLGTKNIQ